MLFYRLILLSWLAYQYEVTRGYVFQAHRPAGLRISQRASRQPPNAFSKSITPNQGLVPNRPQTPSLVPQQRVQRPNHVTGNSRSLMTQVITSSLHHHGDKPRKFIDFLDNGAQWHHFISKPRRHQQELRINEGNYHVNLKYGNHELQEQDDRRNRNPDMYIGETISGENSLSKFTAPPVYDEESASFQRKTKLDLNYEADTPEAAATEKQNTEQFVNRLHSLMTPLGALSPAYEFAKGRGKKESYKLMQNHEVKDGEVNMEHDDDIDDDSPPSEFQRLPPTEAKPDRKGGFPDTMSRKNVGGKEGVRQALEGDGTMDIINKYGLGDEFKGNKGGYHSNAHGYHGDEDMEEVKGERKQQVEIRDGEDNRVVKSGPYDGDKSVKSASYERDNEDEDSRESSRWRSTMMENSKRMDEAEGGSEKDEITKDYEDMKKEVDEGDDGDN